MGKFDLLFVFLIKILSSKLSRFDLGLLKNRSSTFLFCSAASHFVQIFLISSLPLSINSSCRAVGVIYPFRSPFFFLSIHFRFFSFLLLVIVCSPMFAIALFLRLTSSFIQIWLIPFSISELFLKLMFDLSSVNITLNWSSSFV